MRTEQIGERTAVVVSCYRVNGRIQQTAEEFPRTVSVAQTCPEVQFPGAAPTGSLVAAAVQGNTAGLCEFGCTFGRNKITRMQAIQM